LKLQIVVLFFGKQSPYSCSPRSVGRLMLFQPSQIVLGEIQGISATLAPLI